MDFASALLARAVDKYGVDPDNLDLTSTDPKYIGPARVYCSFEKNCPWAWAPIKYRPSMAGNIIFVALFLMLLGGQLFYGIRKKTWGYMASVSLGILGETIGYVGRVLLYKNPWIQNYFLINLICLTIAPALLTAGIYLCLSRVIVAIGAENSRIKPKMYTYIFVGADLLALVLQAIGGGMAATAKDNKAGRRGTDIMIAGLISQVVSMVLFFIIWGNFIIRTRRARISGSLARTQPPLYDALRATTKFKLFQWSLFFATVFIFIRCVYRVAELWEGFNGHLANDQLTFMIFEGPMIIIAVAAMTFFHPGRVFGNLWIPAGNGIRSQKLGASASSIELNGGEEGWKNDHSGYQRA